MHSVVLLGVTRIQLRPTWRGAVCDPSHWAQLHLIEHSGAPHASRPPRQLRSRGLPSWTGNGQLASSRSSTPPARFGRATDAAGPAHHGLGSSPIGVPIGDAIRRIRRCTPCVWCVCVCEEVVDACTKHSSHVVSLMQNVSVHNSFSDSIVRSC